jgi:hypothetical protein
MQNCVITVNPASFSVVEYLEITQKLKGSTDYVGLTSFYERIYNPNKPFHINSLTVIQL